MAEPRGDAPPAGPVLALGVEEVLAWLEGRPDPEAAAALSALIREEARLAAGNRLAPYADVVAPVVEGLPRDRRAALVARLDPAEAVIAQRGSFRTVRPAVRAELLADLPPATAGALLDAMSQGYDGPREAVRVLVAVPPRRAAAALEASAPATRARLSGLLDPALAVALVAAGPALLGELALDPDRAIDHRSVVAEARAVGALPVQDAVARLLAGGPRRRAAVLAAMSAGPAARLVGEMAIDAPGQAARALLDVAEWVLDGSGDRVLHGARAAALLDRLDPAHAGAGALLRAIPAGSLRELLGRCAPGVADRLGPLAGLAPVASTPVAYPRVTASGTRRSRRSAPLAAFGTRHVRIEEEVRAADGRRRLRVDVLEFDAATVRLEPRRALEAAGVLPASQALALLGGSRHGRSPSADTFARLGLVRLADAVHGAGALGGINGGFYVDYGHLLDLGVDLGIDLAGVPGLRFGDPIGWYVQDGTEVTPPVFGRAALITTRDGATHLRRVSMVGCRLAGGEVLRWTVANGPRSGATTLFTGLAGFHTPRDAGYVDLAIAGGRVNTIVPGGGAAIPLTGYVVSVPRAAPGIDLAAVRPGDAVTTLDDFPEDLGRPLHAMGCGPLLVRDGQVDLDLLAEEFGEKDTATLPFSLTRSVDRFRAARSFVGLSAGRLVLGVVSGTRLGAGAPTVSAGATFGELAQLCADLGLEEAMALDGGGSSSLVARMDEDRPATVLNVPTGGSDVPEGHERFINTHLLVFPS
jgi:hypothetical protein